MPAGPSAGVCPRCAAEFLKGTQTEGAVAGEGRHIFTPPTASDLAAKFPQLEILGFVGQGGMGAVYKARQRQLDRIVALKILRPDIGKDLAFAERFAREAKALAKLNHPGIVTIHDFGCAEGLFYFLMEFVDGVSLGQLMRGGRISPREALAIVPQICDALQYAHDQGLVHRDIKPENILLDRRGRVKVADFGLVKLIESARESTTADISAASESPNLTDAGKVMGTPHYMAPEQAEHPAEVDHRADIYALGVVFYQMLTGELPGKPLAAPSKKVQVDVRLDQVVLRALESEPELRFQQASQVKTAVETILQDSIPGPQKRETRTQGKSASSAGARRQPVHYFWGLGILLILVGLVVALLAVRFFRRQVAMREAIAAEAIAAKALAARAPVSAIPAETGQVRIYLHLIGTVESTNSATFAIAEEYAPEIIRKRNAGQTLTVQAFDHQGEPFGHGVLKSVANEIDVATGTLKCTATLVAEAGKPMIPGFFLDIRLFLGVKDGVVRIPADAVVRDQATPFVWLINPDRTVTHRTVQLGTIEDKEPESQSIMLSRALDDRARKEAADGRPQRFFGPWAEIQSGLSSGELVVIEPPGGLREGQQIRYEVVSTEPANEGASPHP
jgi:serine/threonine protein kinase